MKKLSFFSVIVALTFMFGACNKSVSDQIEDEGLTVGTKSFVWADSPTKGYKAYLYSYGQVTASDFAHFESGGTQFNNGTDFPVPGTNGSITLSRYDNGNGPVYIHFSPDALKLLKDGEDCDYSIGVRFKGSLNAVWTFNIFNSVMYCIADDLIAKAKGQKQGMGILIDGKTMGAVTQIRFGGAAAFACEPVENCVEYTVNFFNVEGEFYIGQPVTTCYDADGNYISGGKIDWDWMGDNGDEQLGFSPLPKCYIFIGYQDMNDPDIIIYHNQGGSFIVKQDLDLKPLFELDRDCDPDDPTDPCDPKPNPFEIIFRDLDCSTPVFPAWAEIVKVSEEEGCWLQFLADPDYLTEAEGKLLIPDCKVFIGWTANGVDLVELPVLLEEDLYLCPIIEDKVCPEGKICVNGVCVDNSVVSITLARSVSLQNLNNNACSVPLTITMLDGSTVEVNYSLSGVNGGQKGNANRDFTYGGVVYCLTFYWNDNNWVNNVTPCK